MTVISGDGEKSDRLLGLGAAYTTVAREEKQACIKTDGVHN